MSTLLLVLVELVVLALVEVVDKCEVADIVVVFQLVSETVGEDEDDAVVLLIEV